MATTNRAAAGPGTGTHTGAHAGMKAGAVLIKVQKIVPCFFIVWKYRWL